MTIFDKFSLKGQVAIVTGGGGHLGTEFCKTLAEAGASIVVADLLIDHANRTSKLLTDSGYANFPFELDVTRIESTRELAAETVKRFGRLDILVNCAALDPKFDPDAASKGIAPGAFEDYPPSFEKAMNHPQGPLVAIIGGAKVSGKLEMLENIIKKVDVILIGGGMAFTFLKAQGLESRQIPGRR